MDNRELGSCLTILGAAIRSETRPMAALGRSVPPLDHGGARVRRTTSALAVFADAIIGQWLARRGGSEMAARPQPGGQCRMAGCKDRRVDAHSRGNRRAATAHAGRSGALSRGD